MWNNKQVVALVVIGLLMATYGCASPPSEGNVSNKFTLEMSKKDEQWHVTVRASEFLGDQEQLQQQAAESAALACGAVLPPTAKLKPKSLGAVLDSAGTLLEFIGEQLRTEYFWSGPCSAFREHE